MEEIWKDIPDYEGLYQVSNLGRVKSLPKEWIAGNNTIQKHNGMIIKQQITNNGYKKVVFTLRERKPNSTSRLVHQLVAMAFLNHKPCGHKLVVDHINDNPSDNRVENLQIVTQRFNVCKTQGKYSSKYKGVYFVKSRNKWRAQIMINNKKKYLGHFDCELKAAKAYQNAINNLEL